MLTADLPSSTFAAVPRPHRRRWLVDPIVRGLTGLPLAVITVPMALLGHAATATGIQVRLASRFPATRRGLERHDQHLEARPHPRTTGAPAWARTGAGPREALAEQHPASSGRARQGATSRPGTARVVGHSLLVFLPALVAFGAVAMQLFLVYSGYLYPLRPDTIAALGHPFTPDLEVLPGAWGGPTLVGAWFVHACVALGMQVICGALLIGLCAVQNRVTRWLAP